MAQRNLCVLAQRRERNTNGMDTLYACFSQEMDERI